MGSLQGRSLSASMAYGAVASGARTHRVASRRIGLDLGSTAAPSRSAPDVDGLPARGAKAAEPRGADAATACQRRGSSARRRRPGRREADDSRDAIRARAARPAPRRGALDRRAGAAPASTAEEGPSRAARASRPRGDGVLRSLRRAGPNRGPRAAPSAPGTAVTSSTRRLVYHDRAAPAHGPRRRRPRRFTTGSERRPRRGPNGPKNRKETTHRHDSRKRVASTS